jgi:hypothetical protein
MNMTNILHQLIDVGNCMGAVDSVHMYDTNFLSVDGKTSDGKQFSITINIKGEEKDA